MLDILTKILYTLHATKEETMTKQASKHGSKHGRIQRRDKGGKVGRILGRRG